MEEVTFLIQKYLNEIKIEKVSFGEYKDITLHIPKEMVKEYIGVKSNNGVKNLTYQNCANLFHRETKLLEHVVQANKGAFKGRVFLREGHGFDSFLQEASSKKAYYEFFAIEVPR
ncbi:hypothetical protein ACFLZZ_04130 [Nanoarchaeota archaeon]